MEPTAGGNHFRAGLAVAGVFTAGHLVLSRVLTGQGAQLENRLAVLVAALFMAAACGLATRTTRPGVRRGWVLLSMTGALWTFSNALAARAEILTRRALPIPSLADAPSALAVLLAILGVLSFLGAMLSSAGRMRALVDGLLVASSMVFLGWALLLRNLVAQTSGDAQQFLALAYPFGDVVLVALVLATFPRIGSKGAWVLLAGGLGILTVGHVTLAYFEVAQLAFLGGFEGTAWMIGCFLIGLSALSGDRDLRPATEDPRSGGPLDIVVPLLPVALAGGIGLNRIIEGNFDNFLLVNGAVIAILLVARQMLSQLDFLGLNRELEGRVAARTSQLSRQERQFRSLVQNSSDVVTIVDAGGVIRYQSASSTRVLGYGFGQLVGTNVLDIVHPQAREEVHSLLNAAPAPPAPPTIVEALVRKADGSWALTETTVSNLLRDESVGGLLLTTRDISKRKALENQLRHQALHDPLTGLANRILFMERLNHAVQRAGRDPETLAVLLLDLDGFKQVNDSLGHGAGDDLLAQVAVRMKDSVRPGDTVARMGGDEFAVLLERSREEAPTVVAQRVLNKLRAPVLIGGKPLVVQGSIGVAAGSTAEHGAEALLRNADLAMYEAKSRGKGTFSSFVPAMHSAMLRRVELEADLRRAINDNELLLHYQPLVGLPDGRITGAEALVRWNHPEKGLIPPNEFIPVAEDSDLALSLGRVVLVEACKEARRVAEIVGEDNTITMAINISSQQLTSQWLVHEVARAIEDTGVDPTCLVLEITEGAVMGELRPILATLEGLKQLGVKLAIDDFGTGWSSLSRLHSFPIDKLKVDQSFISGVRSRGDDAPIAAAVVAMARSLHLATVAEGVETIEQLALVDQLGCREIQGYLFSKPIPREAFEDLLRNSPDLRLPGSEETLEKAQLASRQPGAVTTPTSSRGGEELSLEGSIEELKRAIGADLVSLFEMHWDERALITVAASGSEGLHLSAGERFDWDGSPCQKFIESGSHVFTDLALDFPQHLIAIRGGRAYAAVPVQGDGGVLLGTLSAVKRTPEPFAEGLLTTLRTVARMLTPDLESLAAKRAAASSQETPAASPAA